MIEKSKKGTSSAGIACTGARALVCGSPSKETDWHVVAGWTIFLPFTLIVLGAFCFGRCIEAAVNSVWIYR